MKPGTPERLTRWQLSPKLNVSHPVQDDIAWAADRIAADAKEIARLQAEVDAQNAQYAELADERDEFRVENTRLTAALEQIKTALPTQAEMETAHDALSRFCKAAWGHKDQHIFTIPVDVNRDADMQIARVFDKIEEVVKVLTPDLPAAEAQVCCCDGHVFGPCAPCPVHGTEPALAHPRTTDPEARDVGESKG